MNNQNWTKYGRDARDRVLSQINTQSREAYDTVWGLAYTNLRESVWRPLAGSIWEHILQQSVTRGK